MGMAWGALVFVVASVARAQSSDGIDKDSFLRVAGQRWEALTSGSASLPHATITQGVSFVPLTDLIRGQDQVSVDNMLAKLRDKIAAGEVKWDATAQSWRLGFDGGRSSVPLGDPIQLVKGPQGYVVADGHHDLFLSLYLGATTVAADVKEDLSHLPTKEFWERLRREGLTYLAADPESLTVRIPPMMQVRDNPNRYLAALIAYKVTLDTGAVPATVVAAKGSKVPAWVKVNDSVPFVEFYVAQALTAAGIVYDPKWGSKVPPEILEKCRAALRLAQRTGHPVELRRIPVPASAEEAARIGGDKDYLLAWLAPQKSCAADLLRQLLP